MDIWSGWMEREVSLKSKKTEEKTVEATEGAAIRQERAARRKKTFYGINLVGFAPFLSLVENESEKDENKKRIANKAAEYRKRRWVVKRGVRNNFFPWAVL
jgi:hypothetical protein